MASPRKKTHARKESPGTPREAEEVEGDEKRTGTRPDEMPPEVLEFIQAIDEYKRIHRRPFPTWSEVLEVLKTLGYSRT